VANREEDLKQDPKSLYRLFLPIASPPRERGWTPTEKWARLVLFIVIVAGLFFMIILLGQGRPVELVVVGSVAFAVLAAVFYRMWKKGYFPF